MLTVSALYLHTVKASCNGVFSSRLKVGDEGFDLFYRELVGDWCAADWNGTWAYAVGTTHVPELSENERSVCMDSIGDLIHANISPKSQGQNGDKNLQIATLRLVWEYINLGRWGSYQRPP